MSGLQIFLLLLAVCAFSVDPDEHALRTRPPLFAISPETTFINGPLTPHGTIDYIAYLNQRYSEGVTPENNAAVLLCDAFGPEIVEEHNREVKFALLRMPIPSTDGRYLAGLEGYGQQLFGEGDGTRLMELKAESRSLLGVAWTSADHPRIDDWIDLNEHPLEIVEGAAGCSQMFIPLACNDGNYLLNTFWSPCSDRLLWSVQMLCRRATRDLDTADLAESWHDVTTSLRIVRLLTAPSIDRESIHASTAQRECFYAIEVLLNSKHMTERMALDTLEMFQREATPLSYRGWNELNRLICLNAVQEIAAGKMTLREVNAEHAGWDTIDYDEYPLPRSWVRRGEFVKRVFFNLIIDWDAGLVVVNDWYDRLDAAFAARTAETRRQMLDEFHDSFVDLKGNLVRRSDVDRLFRPNMSRERQGRLYGELVFAIWGSPFESLHRTLLRSEAYLRLIPVGLALAAYRARYEKYPAELSDLVPDYLESLPVDPYTNTPFIYRRNGIGYLLYAVGPNLVDDGGVDVRENSDDFDVVLRVDHSQ